MSYGVPASAAEFYISSLQAPTEISGVWRFHTGDDLAWADPDYNHARWDNILAPRDWRRQGHDDYTGMAWYRAVVEFDLSDPQIRSDIQQLGISLGKIHSAYELYVNGVLLGGAGRLPPEPVMVHDRMRIFAVPAALVGADGRLTIAVRVWRAEGLARASTSGMYEEPVRIGTVFDLTKEIWIHEVGTLTLVIIYLTFAIYHLYLYSRNRRSPDFFWFGVTTLLVAIYSLEISQWRFVGDWLPYLIHKRLEYFALFLLPPMGLQLVWSLLHHRPNRIQRGYQLLLLAFAVLAILVPEYQLHVHMLFPWQLCLLPGLVGVLVHVLWNAVHGSAEARVMLVGWGVFVATAFNDIMVTQGLLQTPRMLTLGFSAILLTMGLLLANRFSRMQNELEKEVQLRTQELRASNAKLIEVAHIDALTGLENRRGFADAVEVEIARAGRTHRGFVLVMADIDHFKVFNDQHGHACGDYVLKEIATLLRAQLRALDVVARWGGEEFIFLLPETSLEGGTILAEKLRSVIESQRIVYRGNIVLSIAITLGVAQYEEGMDLDNCLARADRALYEGKQAGRNRVVVDASSSPRRYNITPTPV